MKKLLFFAIAIFGFSAVSFGQSTASTTATASAKIINPITITKVTDMNFGIINSNAVAGNVVLSPAGGRTPTTVTLAPSAGVNAVTAASFTVTGESGYLYTVTLPSTDVTLARTGGGGSMTLNNFTSDAGTTLPSGSFTLSVGGQLNLEAGQASGNYTSTAFNVQVAYN